MDQGSNPVLQFEGWTAPGDIFTYLIREQSEDKPYSREIGLDSTFDDAILTCAMLPRNSESTAEKTKGKEPASEATQASVPSGGEDSSDDEHEQTIGEAWLTYEHSPLHETAQEGEYSWVLLAREKGFKTSDGGFVTRPDNFPEGRLSYSK